MESEQQSRMGIAMDMVPGTDGNVWPRLQFLSPNMAFIFTVPVEVFEQFLTQLYNEGTKCIKQVKEENSPLKVHREMPEKFRQRRG